MEVALCMWQFGTKLTKLNYSRVVNILWPVWVIDCLHWQAIVPATWPRLIDSVPNSQSYLIWPERCSFQPRSSDLTSPTHKLSHVTWRDVMEPTRGSSTELGPVIFILSQTPKNKMGHVKKNLDLTRVWPLEHHLGGGPHLTWRKKNQTFNWLGTLVVPFQPLLMGMA